MPEDTMELIAFGNAIVDIIAPASDDLLQEEDLPKGGMQLIDERRAEALYARMGPARELSGGSAANTVAGLASLGHRCEFVGQIAQDQIGAVFAHDIRACGVTFREGRTIDTPATGRSLILVTPDGQRTMNTCLGASQHLDARSVDPANVAAARCLFLEGYLWDPEGPRLAMRTAISIAKAAGREVILSLSDAFVVERYRADFLALLKNGQVDILFANRSEVLTFASGRSFDSAMADLRAMVPLLVVTDGENGASCGDRESMWHVPADPEVRVVDTTGAGDMFAAGFLSGYLRGAAKEQCLELGTICAAEAISHFGPRPESDLRERVEARGFAVPPARA